MLMFARYPKRWILSGLLVFTMLLSGLFFSKKILDSIRVTHADTHENEPTEVTRDLTGSRTKREQSSAERERITKHNKRLERLSNEATEAFKKKLATPAPSPIISIDSQGELSESVINSLFLSDSEVESLKSTISETRSKEAKKFTERAELISEPGKQSPADLKYLVRAKRDRGAADREEFAEKVGQVLDEARSKQFMEGVGEVDFYGGFGKYDVELDLYSEDGVDMVKYQYINPATGNTSRFGGGKLNDSNYRSWKALDLPKH